MPSSLWSSVEDQREDGGPGEGQGILIQTRNHDFLSQEESAEVEKKKASWREVPENLAGCLGMQNEELGWNPERRLSAYGYLRNWTLRSFCQIECGEETGLAVEMGTLDQTR